MSSAIGRSSERTKRWMAQGGEASRTWSDIVGISTAICQIFGKPFASVRPARASAKYTSKNRRDASGRPGRYCEQYLTEPPLLGKQQAIDDSLSIDFDLPDLAAEVIDINVTAPDVTHLFHCRSYSRRILIGDLIQELAHRLTAS